MENCGPTQTVQASGDSTLVHSSIKEGGKKGNDANYHNNDNNDKEKRKISQLVRMCEAMGGPRFGNFSLQPGQDDDNIEALAPLLEDYLQQDGNNIDDTASFEDYFGTNIYLEGWTLLRAATSVWVNAPRCIRLLLARGANPLLPDSSGRHVFTEALSTARHGYDQPWRILVDHLQQKDIPTMNNPDFLSAAKLSDVTECLIKKLREGKGTSISTWETRRSFMTSFTEGFRFFKKHYPPEDVQLFLEEMHLVKLTYLQARKNLPGFAEASEEGGGLVSLRDFVAENAGGYVSANNYKVIFVSHRWLQPWKGHPDDPHGTKHRMIVDAALAYCEKYSIPPHDIFLWIDYVCINQANSGCKFRSIQTLPFYIMMCDGFLAVSHSEYMTRAWCQLEVKFASSMTACTDDFGFYRYTLPSLATETLPGSALMNRSSTSSSCLAPLDPHAFIQSNPGEGKVSDVSDLHYITALSWFATDAARYAAAVSSYVSS